MTIIGIGGSPRSGGNTDVLLDTLLAGARDAGRETSIVQLRDLEFSLCIGCEECRELKECVFGDEMNELARQIMDSSGLVLASPTHNYNVSALMKAFIDRLYPFYDFTDDRPRRYSSRLAGQGMVAAAVAVAEQVDIDDMGFALEGMSRVLDVLGLKVVGQLPVLGIFDAGLVSQKSHILNQAESLGRKIGESARR